MVSTHTTTTTTLTTTTKYCCRFLLANCCIGLGKLPEAERVLLEGTDVLHKGPKDCREEILAEPCPIPFGAAGLRLLGKRLVVLLPGTVDSWQLQQRPVLNDAYDARTHC